MAEHGGTRRRTRRARSPRRSDVVITMVVDGAQVEEMMLGDDGALPGAREGTLFVDMSTIAPAHARARSPSASQARATRSSTRR